MSKELFNVDKESNSSEWYSQVLQKAEIVDIRYPVKGFVVYQPWGFGILKRLFQEVEKRWDSVGYKATHFPIAVPDYFFEKEAEHAKGFKAETFWIDLGKEEGRIGLAPTSEAVMYSMFSQWIRSYNELPFKVYQTSSVYRFETKATRPLFRGRELYWNEAHAASKDAEACKENVDEARKVYNDLFENELGMAALVFKRPEWDKFAGADTTYAYDALMPSGKVLQVATTHFLGQGFAKSFNVKFLDEKNTEQFAFMSSHGISMRAMGGLLLMHGDNKGLILPANLAPTQIVLVPIASDKDLEGSKQALQKCIELGDSLAQMGFRVHVDNSDKRPGEKYYYWEMKGVPLRIEIGPRDVKTHSCVVTRRDTGEKKNVLYDLDLFKFLEFLKGWEQDILSTLYKRSLTRLEGSIRSVKSLPEVKAAIEKEGGVLAAGFCSMDSKGEECAEKLKAEVPGTEVRGELVHAPHTLKLERLEKGANCVVCGKEAQHLAYLARSY